MIRFTIEQHQDTWSFETEEHGLHMGYPDALQATAAAMRAFDPTLPRLDIDVADLRSAVALTKRSQLKLIRPYPNWQKTHNPYVFTMQIDDAQYEALVDNDLVKAKKSDEPEYIWFTSLDDARQYFHRQEGLIP